MGPEIDTTSVAGYRIGRDQCHCGLINVACDAGQSRTARPLLYWDVTLTDLAFASASVSECLLTGLLEKIVDTHTLISRLQGERIPFDAVRETSRRRKTIQFARRK
jgi:hypothetical protein